MYLLKENTVVTAREPKATGQDIRYEHSANHSVLLFAYRSSGIKPPKERVMKSGHHLSI